MKTLKTKTLEPHTAIAFTERQWNNWVRKTKDYLIEKEIYLMITGLRGYLPFARVVVITFGKVGDEITDDEKEVVAEALKKNRSFRRLMEKTGGDGQLVWENTRGSDLLIDENGCVRLVSKKPPAFYVLVNDKGKPVEMPV
jgi:hypothetical protein